MKPGFNRVILRRAIVEDSFDSDISPKNIATLFEASPDCKDYVIKHVGREVRYNEQAGDLLEKDSKYEYFLLAESAIQLFL